VTPPDAADEAVAAVLDRLYDCLEERRFLDLATVLDLDEIDLYGWRKPSRRLAECVADRLDGSEDVSLFMLRVLEQRAEQGRVVYRGTACLLSSPIGSWEDHELEFDVTSEVVREASGDWRLSYLAIDPPTPERVPFPDDPAPPTPGA
jgi:hypothetical protein